MKIENLKNGKKRTRVTYYKDGQRKFKTFTASSLSELKIMVSEFILETERVGGGSRTLRMACIGYIKSRVNILSPSTIVGYKKTIRNEFQPLMEMDVSEIRDGDLQQCINKMSARLSTKTIKNHYSFIHSVLVENTGRSYKVDFPPRVKPKEYIPSDEDIEKLLTYVKGDRMEIPIMLGAYLGLRRGEICALTNDDVNLRKKTISITKAIVTNDRKEDVIKQPKTYASYRTLDIPKPLFTLLQKRIKAGEPIIDVTLSVITHQFPRILERCGIPHFPFHKLRHYFASVVVKMGVPDVYAMKLTGHSTTSILKAVYQHTMSDKEREVRDLVRKNFE